MWNAAAEPCDDSSDSLIAMNGNAASRSLGKIIHLITRRAGTAAAGRMFSPTPYARLYSSVPATYV